MECCSKCKYMFLLKELVNHEWKYYNVCCYFPITDPDDKFSFAMIIHKPDVEHCECFTELT